MSDSVPDRRKNTFRDASTWTPEFREGVLRRLQMRDKEFLIQAQVEFAETILPEINPSSA